MTYREMAEELMRMHFSDFGAVPNGMAGASSAPGEDSVLFTLYHCEDGCLNPGDLAEKLHLTSGRIANILKRLEEKGLIVRKPGEHDRRRIAVCLTDLGERRARSYEEAFIDRAEAMLSGLGEEDAAEWVRLSKLISAAGGV